MNSKSVILLDSTDFDKLEVMKKIRIHTFWQILNDAVCLHLVCTQRVGAKDGGMENVHSELVCDS